MASTGGRFRLDQPALDRRADARRLEHPARTECKPPDPRRRAVLEIGPAEAGVAGWALLVGSQRNAAWRAQPKPAGIGRPLRAGDGLPLAPDPAPDAPTRSLPAPDRFTGGTLRVIPGPQTALFAPETRARFYATAFRAAQGNRQGLTLTGGLFTLAEARSILSEPVTEGDIQMTGAGVPAILLAECQTIGGYPRIGTVIPADLPRAAQSAPGTVLRFKEITLAEAEAACPTEPAELAALRTEARPVAALPGDSAALLGYQLIGGAIRGDEEEEWRAGSI
ncbi:MAG: urea amidolyase [Paracoccaceae bacterium]